MIEMEYRSRIKVPGLPYEREEEHTRLHGVLLRDHLELGPVMSWEGDATVVVLGIDAEDEAEAAAKLSAAVADSLHSCGLGHLYPAAVEIEPADDLATA